MRIVCQTFSLPKEGRELADYEDASYPYCANQFTCIEAHPDIAQYRAAVTDGATDAVFSKQWAEMVAAAYGAGEWAEELNANSLTRLQSQWSDFVSKQELPWYAEEKVQLGAFCAFAGLTLLKEKQQWRAVAVGDSCLFHTREGKLVDAFPVTKSDDFSNFPFLLGSLAEKNEGVFEKKSVRLDGRWQSGDVFFLMSDALACWFLRSVEEGFGEELIDWFTRLELHDVFSEVVRSQRCQTNENGVPNMRDDDVTLVRVSVNSRQAPVDVPGGTETATAQSIQTLTLDAQAKREVNRRTLPMDVPAEARTTPVSTSTRSPATPSAPVAPAIRFESAPVSPPVSPPRGAAERAAMRMSASPANAPNQRKNILVGALVVGVAGLIALAGNAIMHSKSNSPSSPNKKPGALLTKNGKPGTARGADLSGESDTGAPPVASAPPVKEGVAGIASGVEAQPSAGAPLASGNKKRQAKSAFPDLTPDEPIGRNKGGSFGGFPDQPGKGNNGFGDDHSGKIQYQRYQRPEQETQE